MNYGARINSFCINKLDSNFRNNSNEILNKSNDKKNEYNLTEFLKYRIEFIVLKLKNENENFFLKKIIFFDINEQIIKPINVRYKTINCKCEKSNFVKLFLKNNDNNIKFEIDSSYNSYKIYIEFLSNFKINYIKLFNEENLNSIKFLNLFLNDNNIFNNELNPKNTIVNVNTHNLTNLKRYKSENRTCEKKEKLLLNLFEKIKIIEKNKKNNIISKKSKPLVNHSIINLFIKKEENLEKISRNNSRISNNPEIKNSFNLNNDRSKNLIKIKKRSKYNLNYKKNYTNENISDTDIYLNLSKKKSLKNNIEFKNEKILNINKNYSKNNIINVFSRKSFLRKSNDIKYNCFKSLLNDYKNFKIPELPFGKNWKLICYDNYGDKNYIGFSGIEIYDDKGDNILILNENIKTNSDNFNNISNINNGIYLKGFDNQLYYTNLDILPLEINIRFKDYKKISKIRIWNYSNPNKFNTSIKNIQVCLEKKVIFFGKLSIPTQENFNYDNIYFTIKEDIINNIQKRDWFEDIVKKINIKPEKKFNITNNSGFSFMNFGDNIYTLTLEILENYYVKEELVKFKIQLKNKNNKILKLNCISKPKNCKFEKLINNFYSFEFIYKSDYKAKFSFIFKSNSSLKVIQYENLNKIDKLFTKWLFIQVNPPKACLNSNLIKKKINFHQNEKLKLINFHFPSRNNINKEKYFKIKNLQFNQFKLLFHSNLGNNNQIGFEKIIIYDDKKRNIFDLINNHELVACSNNFFSFNNYEESNYPNKNTLSEDWVEFINKENDNNLASYELKVNKLMKISSIEFYNNSKNIDKSVGDFSILLNNMIVYQGRMKNLLENNTNLSIINFDWDKTIKNLVDFDKNQEVKFINKDL